MLNETFADRLKYAMERRGIKQVDLIRTASERGIKLGKSHVSQYVSGKTVPRAEIIRFWQTLLMSGKAGLTAAKSPGLRLPPRLESSMRKTNCQEEETCANLRNHQN